MVKGKGAADARRQLRSPLAFTPASSLQHSAPSAVPDVPADVLLPDDAVQDARVGPSAVLETAPGATAASSGDGDVLPM
jgi:hypothetical protein